MPDARFESGSFSILGDMTSQNFPLKKGTSDGIQIFPCKIGLTLMSFYVQNRSSRPKIDPHV